MYRRDFLKGVAGSGGAALALAGLAGEAASAEAASESGLALAELRAAIAEVEEGFRAPAWRLQGPSDFAEARGYLATTLQHALECWMPADPLRPAFVRFVTPEKKLLGDNPDAVYFTAPVRADARYRIRGNTAGATYTSFTVEIGTGEGGNSRKIGATLNDSQFQIAPDGSYEIAVSTERQEGNWLRLDPDAGSITTRHYYERATPIAADRLHHIPLVIENAGDPGPAPVPNDAAIAAGLRRAARFLRTTVQPPRTDAGLPRFVSPVPNQLPQPLLDEGNAEVGFAAADNVYSMAPFLLKPGEALVIRGRFPRCRFANVVLWNRFLQTLDYERRQTSLNRKQAQQEADGSFKMVVAARDPGVPNWLDSEGRPFGTVFWRFQLPEEEIAPLNTWVVPLSEVASV
jgi:hypothetical protein